VHLAGLHTVVRVSAASSQLILLQVGPRRCLQRLRVAPFWFFQLLFLRRRHRHVRSRDYTNRSLSRSMCFVSWSRGNGLYGSELKAEVGYDTERKLGRLSPRRLPLRHVSLPAAMQSRVTRR
jgi:hypothetical protein